MGAMGEGGNERKPLLKVKAVPRRAPGTDMPLLSCHVVMTQSPPPPISMSQSSTAQYAHTRSNPIHISTQPHDINL